MQTYTQFAMKGNSPVATAAAETVQHMVVVLDNSGSMRATDYPPDRWGAAAQACEALLVIKASQYPTDRVGIVAFGTGARVLYPLANVRENLPAMKLAMDVSDTDGSTNIAAGLDLAQQLLKDESVAIRTGPGVFSRLASLLYDSAQHQSEQPERATRERVIIVLTDGHSTEGRTKAISKRIKTVGIRIDAIGIGGSPSNVDEPLLKDIVSKNSDGTPRYCFIGDQSQLITTFQSLAHHIRRL